MMIHRLGHRQRAALYAMVRARRPMSVPEIAEAIGLGGASRSRRYAVIRSLHERGLIECVRDPSNPSRAVWRVVSGAMWWDDVL